MKVIIAGGREFNNYTKLTYHCDKILSNKPQVEIVSGGAEGADRLGEDYAKSKGHSVTRFPADWNKHGKAAGPIRNREMAEYADGLIAFWDGTSSGTANMIKEAQKRNLKIRIIRY